MKKDFWKHCPRAIFLAVLLLFTLSIAGQPRVVQAAKKGFTTINGKRYYIKEDGSKQKGWLTLNGKKYYFNTKTGVQLRGWQKDESGKKIRYFTKNAGYMATGFLTDNSGNTRYFQPKDGLMVRGWMTDGEGNKYYFSKGAGIMAKGWLKDSKEQKRYFSKANGRMLTGWQTAANGNIRYFDEKTGVMYQKGLTRIDGYYYYFAKSNGVLYRKGFGTASGEKYYFDPETGRAKTGWLTLDGKRYYFSTKGVMFRSTVSNIDGTAYEFDENGVATETAYEMQGDKVKMYDPGNDKYYYVTKEYLTHPGIANGETSDVELLAALCESEAGDQGKIGMVAVALCVLNRTIIEDKEFPSQLRMAIYHIGANHSFPQYTVVSNGALLKRLQGQFENRELAMEAAAEAIEMHKQYVLNKKPRKLSGFKTKDFNYMYFMTEAAFWKQPLNFSKVEYCKYKDHVFFVNWVS